MANKNEQEMRSSVYELIYHSPNIRLIDFLTDSSCDEMLDIDLNRDTFEMHYHVEGKYYVPVPSLSFRYLYHYTSEHIVHPEDKDLYLRLMDPDTIFDRFKASKIPNFLSARFRYRLQSGGYRYVEQCVIAGEENGFAPGVFRIFIFDVHNYVIRQVASYFDESHTVMRNREIDEVTGLPLEHSFIAEAISISKRRPNVDWAIFSIDIAHFRFFNEWYGREAADHLIGQIGGVLFDAAKDSGGCAGYFGQDVFGFLAPFDMEKTDHLYDVIRSIVDSFELSAGFLPVIGVAKLEPGLTIDAAFDRATVAAASAKKDARSRIALYNPSMHAQAAAEYQILTEFLTAYKNEEITFYLQPQCRISTGAIVGAESLARWIKPDGSIVSPLTYIPVLEKYGFIVELDQYLWEKVCQWLRKLLDEGKNPLPISVNVSRADIFATDIAKHFHDLAEKYQLPHSLLKLEITESAYVETTEVVGTLVDALRRDGFMVLMDDFGSGYSSLNMLGTLQLDAIKLDAFFLHAEGEDFDRKMHILESVINLAKTIAMPIIVEGVENQSQSDFLESLGCRYVQGFHFYRPMPVRDLEAIIADESRVDRAGFVVKTNEQFRIREFLDENIYSDSMLNNILGAVAIYSWDGKDQTDIVRFNQQFYEAVNVPDFHERITNIERWMPKEDIPEMHIALREAKQNRLAGSMANVRFYKTDGTLSEYTIHFYYLGKQEGEDRYYGSARNITELADLKDEMYLVSKYSGDNMIFIHFVDKRWRYRVVSHNLSDIVGLSPSGLEEEMNNRRFVARVVDQGDLANLMNEGRGHAEKNEDFSYDLLIYDKNRKIRKIHLEFTNVAKQTNNTVYILQSDIIE